MTNQFRYLSVSSNFDHVTRNSEFMEVNMLDHSWRQLTIKYQINVFLQLLKCK